MILNLQRLVTHIVYAPTFYFVRLSVWFEPDHPLNDITDIHRWAAHATPCLRVWNHLLWASLVIEAFALVAVVNYYTA